MPVFTPACRQGRTQEDAQLSPRLTSKLNCDFGMAGKGWEKANGEQQLCVLEK